MSYIYKADVIKDKPQQPDTKVVKLFGHDLLVYDDAWRNHLHVICTYKCNANCSFCIERNSKCREINLTDRLKSVLAEMKKAGILHTVSFTGGEPSLCNQLEKLLSLVPAGVFTTINTNGTNLTKVAKMGFDCVNVSRHYVDDARNKEVFGCSVPTLHEINKINVHPNTKLRIQAVVNEYTKLEDYLKLIESGICYDLSFRSIMLDGSRTAKYYHELYQNLIESAFALGSEVIEQEIQDYYVYEVHKIEDKLVTFSYSNMEEALREDNEPTTELVREFILRPDGSLSGSWEVGKRILLK